ncbi:MAG: PCRF domain-containing protein, partial [Clostridia bacterium]|nr:PCRF domain-containing protein [Clostridia bacterium]
MIIALEDAKGKLYTLQEDLVELGRALRIEELKAMVFDEEQQTMDPAFWNDPDKSSRVLQGIKQKKDTIENYTRLVARLEDVLALCEMAIEENDEDSVEEVLSEMDAVEKEEEKQRIGVLLSGEYDKNNAIVSFHPGAGGTEAQDWA